MDGDNPIVEPGDESTYFYQNNSYTPTQSAGFLMRRVLGSILQQADSQLQQHGLTYVQWLPLYRLMVCPDATHAQLAKDLAMDPASVTRALDRIELKGLLRRERSTADRRVVHLVLTDEGRRIAAEVPRVLARVLNHHLAGFSHEECRLLISMLQRMLINGEALRGPFCGLVPDPESAFVMATRAPDAAGR
ncbi:MarR family winged helix-turn-helix transcriptional regulator [Diaphorobacter aerolatus]|uniref:Winged helix-turn-helix transcriptional regulator n=1 Tax=Diaphorobacter aerolatus TaxID=1288495 RepID=A0A7H0GJN5_9BURK|nr:MarR family winged helix-turn-helix transcriptional regulator [Diaphorobacter aerolatus]QNP48501.1 winged helix-turn-helix transcriptional regulator [Diaphorobacter aerolatus]